MVRRQILYCVILLSSTVFLIFHEGYIAFYLFACTLFVPLLSILLSLPVLLSTRLRLSPGEAVYFRGQAGEWWIQTERGGSLPPLRLTLRVVSRNMWTGDGHDRKYSLPRTAGRWRFTLPMDTSHCGMVSARLVSVRMTDYLGLLAFPCRNVEGGTALIVPPPTPQEKIPSFDFPDEQMAVNRRSSSSEDYELRDYREGDPLRSIHWKMSSKWDRLIVKERQGRPPKVVISFNCFGPPEALDRGLENLQAVSNGLLQGGYPHQIRWINAAGERFSGDIYRQEDVLPCMERMLSARAPSREPDLADDPIGDAHVPRIDITSGEEARA